MEDFYFINNWELFNVEEQGCTTHAKDPYKYVMPVNNIILLSNLLCLVIYFKKTKLLNNLLYITEM